MSFRIPPTGQAAKAFRGTAEEQVDKATAEIEDPALDRGEAVHQVRKRCKKLRGLIRLYRGPLEDAGAYKELNARFRDTARPLSDLRDAQVLVETYDALMDRFAGDVARRDFANLRRQLTRRHAELARTGPAPEDRLAEARDRLRDGRSLLRSADVEAEGFAAVAEGLAKTYGRARKASAAAEATGSAVDFHRWRKRAKYHRYHCRLLSRIWPAEMEARRSAAKDVADLLGDGHDLTVLREVLRDEAGRFADGDPVDRLDALALKRREELHAAAIPLGRQLFAEKPKRFAARIGAYWQVAADAKRDPDLPSVRKAEKAA
jgi:CHAD domain-containing protein